jgi:hypothetical protein
VFGGYGIVAPASDHTPELDAYAELDVADKWVLLFRYIQKGLEFEGVFRPVDHRHIKPN